MTGKVDHGLRDSPLEDEIAPLEDEIALLGDVIAGAAHASEHLTDAEVDAIPGVEQSGPGLPHSGN